MKIKRYRVFHKDYEFEEHYHYFLHAPSVALAKQYYFHIISDTWSEAKYIDIRAKLVDRQPTYCSRIEAIADYRGRNYVKAGMKVTDREGRVGHVIDADGGGAYFKVYMEETKTTCYFHPNELKYYDRNGIEIREPEDYLGL